jgi:hypothetical protein
MLRLVPASLAAIMVVAAPALADKLPLPKAAYSADVTFFAKGKETAGHIAVDGPKERRESKNAAGLQSLTIIRRDQGKVYDIKLKRHLAVSLRIAAAEAAGEMGAPGTDIDAFYGQDVEAQGQETIDGLMTTKYAVKIDGGPDLMVNATIWATDDGIIVRVVGKTSIDGDAVARMELKNIQRGPQDPALFEIPAGMELLSTDADSSDTPTKVPDAAPAAPAAPAATPAPAAPAAAAPATGK